MSEPASLTRTMLIGVSLVIIIGLLTYAGSFRFMNTVLMDVMFINLPHKEQAAPVVSVEVHPQLRHDRTVAGKLMDALAAAKAKQVLLVSERGTSETNWARVVADRAKAGMNVYVAGFFKADEAPHSHEVPLGYVDVEAGYHRLWDPDIGAGLMAYQQRHIDARSTDKRIIDFTAGNNAIPKVQAQQILEKTIPDDVFRDKYILVGEKLSQEQPGFSVPFATGQGISLTELQAYILSSALNDRFIDHAPFWSAMLIAGFILLTCFLALQWMELFGATITLMVGVAIALILNYFLIKLNGQIFPIAQSFVVAMMALLMIYQQKRHKEQGTLETLVAEMDARLSERISPRHFNQTERPWSQIITFVNQQLNLNKSIFLEREEKRQRIKEIIAVNCGLDDIDERRRDYGRQPYSDAIEAGRPTRPFRPYFSDMSNGEVEYLVPLIFGGEVLGFWAASVVPDDKWNTKAFENNMRGYADQVAELLYHREQWQEEEKWLDKFWVRVFSFEAGDRLHTRIKQSVQLLENRMDTLEKVFNRLSTASVLYDVFGQILYTNALMERVAKQHDVAIYGNTATEALASFSGLSIEEAKKKIRYIVLKHQGVTFELKSDQSRNTYILHVRPIVTEPDEWSEHVAPFGVLGLLFEFIDLGEIKEMMSYRKNLMQQYFHLIRNDLASVSLAVKQLDKSDDEKKRAMLLQMIEDRMKQTAEKTTQAESEVAQFTSIIEERVTTVNLANLALKVVDEVAMIAQERDVTIESETPHLASLVSCEASTLVHLLNVTLVLLIEDAFPGSTLALHIQEELDAKSVSLALSSNGHGVDSEYLQELYQNTEQSYVDESDPHLVQMLVLAKQIMSSGTEMTIQSEIGQGFSVVMRLPVYKFLG